LATFTDRTQNNEIEIAGESVCPLVALFHVNQSEVNIPIFLHFQCRDWLKSRIDLTKNE